MNASRILIIEDDASLRKTLADILRAKGYETIVAGDGGDGLALLATTPVNLALIDLGLPDVPGIDVLHRVKADFPATETIILTGNACLGSAIEATNRGAFSYLLKPCDIDQLLLHVKRAIEKQQAREEIVRRTAELERVNAELQALNRISAALNRTLNLKELLAEVLQVLAGAEIFPFEVKGAIFLLENGELRRASFINLGEEEMSPCPRAIPEECVCRLALSHGEILVLNSAAADDRFARCHPETAPHGHVIVPLKASDRVVGVLVFFIPEEVSVGKRLIHLLSTISHQIGIAIENARLYEETRLSSLHDALTGLANRRFLDAQLEKTFASAKRYGEPLSAIMLDIDRFKKFNDSHGHAEGDKFLVHLGEILRREMRRADSVFRYGGEEFFILLPRTDAEESGQVAERLRKAVEKEMGRTISLGVSAFADSMRKKEDLVKKADEALYRAKRNGRNRVEVL